MKRFAPGLLVLAGWFFAQVAGTPQEVYAQARTSLASLQSEINALQQLVLGIDADVEALQSDVEIITTSAVFHGQPVQIGPGSVVANAENAGTLRYDPAEGTLKVSNGTEWRTLAYEIAP